MDGEDNLDGIVLRFLRLWRSATLTYARRLIFGIGVALGGSLLVAGMSRSALAFPWLFLMLVLEGWLGSTDLSGPVLVWAFSGMTLIATVLAALNRHSFKLVMLWFLINLIVGRMILNTPMH